MLHRSISALMLACGLVAACAAPSLPPLTPTIPDTATAVAPTARPPKSVTTPSIQPTTAAAEVTPSPEGNPPATEPPVASAAPLLADNQKTANPRLVTTQLRIPSGLQFSKQDVSLPPGFVISVLATGLSHPRFMAFDTAGNLLVADQSGQVIRYPGAAGAIAPSGQAPPPLLTGLNGPSSLTFDANSLYVGETNQVGRYRYHPADSLGPAEVVVPRLPTGGHSTRTVAFGPDGKLYVSVGSSCNICDESDERRAAILRYNADGTGYERFAEGLRNAVGLAFQPETGLLWATVNERDNQGNEIPPDLVTIVRKGEDFGWPRCQPPEATPQFRGANCSGIAPPTIGIQAHSAPLGLAFYTGSVFPSAYRGDLFVAQHGSWNRRPPAAPKLLRIHFANGRPVSVEDFATGWQLPDESRWGRPAGIVQAPNGSLIVSDDQAGVLYQITYDGDR